MKEEKFSLQSSLEANYLNIELNEPMHLDEIAIRVIKEDCPEFLIPFRIVNINDNVTLKYKLINTIALEYANMNLHKGEFIALYLNLLDPFIKGKDWFLDYHNFCIDRRYIFLDKANSNACFIYVPERSYGNTDDEILQFFKETFNSISIRDDAAFQVQLFQFFSRKDITLADLYQLLMREGQNGRSLSYTMPKEPVQQPMQQTPAMQTPIQQTPIQQTPVQQTPMQQTPVQQKPVQQKPMQQTPTAKSPEPQPATVKKHLFGGEKKETPAPAVDFLSSGDASGDADAVMEALFGGKKKKEPVKKPEAVKKQEAPKKSGGFNLFGKKKDAVGNAAAGVSEPILQQTPQSVPVNQGNQNSGAQGFGSQSFGGGFAAMGAPGDDKTEISGEEIASAGAYMELIDSPIPGAIGRISLTFMTPFITIGRESSDEVQPDVAFSKDFSRIGRKHARIEKRGGSYFVIDLGSVNHTILNGQVLIPNQPYQLMDGGELTFTNSKPVRYRIHL